MRKVDAKSSLDWWWTVYRLREYSYFNRLAYTPNRKGKSFEFTRSKRQKDLYILILALAMVLVLYSNILMWGDGLSQQKLSVKKRNFLCFCCLLNLFWLEACRCLIALMIYTFGIQSLNDAICLVTLLLG